MITLAHAIGVAILLLACAFAAFSLQERERRAAVVTIVLGIAAAVPYGGVRFVWSAWREPLAVGLVLLTGAGVIVLALPWRSRLRARDDIPRTRIDERDTMFSRNELSRDSVQYEEYYLRRPANKRPDDDLRRRPGLLRPGTTYFDACMFAAAEASFSSVRALHILVDRDSHARTLEPRNPAALSEFIKRWAVKLGAASAGIAELRDYHVYSFSGRGAAYGEPVSLDHPYAIAVTVEMARAMLDTAPHAPTVMESAQQYVAAGSIAVQLAEFIRGLGYSARAHIDGNYRVVAPLVARDAGLGEIGRMGLLMTPRLGPRVRIAVVTTDMPLAPDGRKRDASVLQFCSRCAKCAANCPAGAIPFGGRAGIGGAQHWQIDQEACFTYWCGAGTDCARCIRVCPYSHPDSAPHTLVRRAIRNSRLFSVVALAMDDLLYGRRPAVRAPEPWMIVDTVPDRGQP